MREHDLQPRRRRRYGATTDSDHDQPIYPNRAKDLAIDGPDQLWVADITYVAIREGFAYVAVILDAWSRRAIGYAISRSIDVRLTLAALNTAVELRKPPPGCIHHSDRGSQYAAQGYREALLRYGLVGSMGRRGNPYDNPKAESFMKTLKVEAVYPMAYETFPDVADDLPKNSSTRSTTLVVSTQRWAISARSSSRISIPGRWSNQPPDFLSAPRGPLQVALFLAAMCAHRTAGVDVKRNGGLAWRLSKKSVPDWSNRPLKKSTALGRNHERNGVPESNPTAAEMSFSTAC